MRLIAFSLGLLVTVQAGAQVRVQNATAFALFEAGTDVRIADEQHAATWIGAHNSYSNPQPPYFFSGHGYAVVGFGLESVLTLDTYSDISQPPGAPAARTLNRASGEIVVTEPTSTWLLCPAGFGLITTSVSQATRFELRPLSASAFIEGLPPEAGGSVVFPGPVPNSGEMCVTLHPGTYWVKLENETYQPEHLQQSSNLRVSSSYALFNFGPINVKFRTPHPHEVCSGGYLVFEPVWQRATEAQWQVEDSRAVGGWVNINGLSHRLANGLNVSADGVIDQSWSEVIFRDYSGIGGQTARVRIRVSNGCGEEAFTEPVTVTVHMCCRADIDWSTRVDAADIFCFLDAWFSKVGLAVHNDPIDWDHSRVIDVNDVFAFLDSWFAEQGC